MTSIDFEERYFIYDEPANVLLDGNKIAYKGFDINYNLPVFVKLINEDLVEFSTLKANTFRKINHPNIINIRDVFVLTPPDDDKFSKNLIVYIYEYVDNFVKLSDYTSPNLSVLDTIIHQLISAIEYLQTHDLIHRDLKPENIVILTESSTTHIKLIDLDYLESVGSITKNIVGTPEYLHPNAVHHQPLFKAIDRWSLGCTLFELVTNELPFGRRNYEESPMAHIASIRKTIASTNFGELLLKVPERYRDIVSTYLSI